MLTLERQQSSQKKRCPQSDSAPEWLEDRRKLSAGVRHPAKTRTAGMAVPVGDGVHYRRQRAVLVGKRV